MVDLGGWTLTAPSGLGTLFAVGANGVPVVLHAFTGGADGRGPVARLTLFTDGNYYGTTSAGARGYGTIFRVTRSGQFSTIYTFTGRADGGSPSGLALRLNIGCGSNLGGRRTINAAIEQLAMTSSRFVAGSMYGTTSTGGSGNSGTIFSITSAGHLQTLRHTSCATRTARTRLRRRIERVLELPQN